MSGSEPVDNPLVDEARKLASALTDQAQQAFGRFREQNPEVFGHLAAAGNELLSAYRAAIAGHERRWSAPERAESEQIDLDD
ncbi:DUF5304 family protein [Kitasatospora azatica]|uniref:DUF5304 family protein n=1 Tax=Kitasatospora azatica TaxID=58347 RepID=UPI00068986A1|nr:DUF5304 family protein [Kitasatospora azatica]